MTNYFEDLYLLGGKAEENLIREAVVEKETDQGKKCAICQAHKEVSVHCVYILPKHQTTLVDVVCQYVCDDCAGVLHQKEHQSGLRDSS